MNISVNDILNYLLSRNLNYKYYGDDSMKISNFCSLKNQKPAAITWIKDFSNYDITKIDKSLNLLIVSDLNAANVENIRGYNLILCNNPKEYFFDILTYFFKGDEEIKISKNSIIDTNKIGRDVTIGHNCYVSKDVTIGDNVIIKNNVSIESKTTIGNNSIINSGVVIGTDGFGYFKNENGDNVKVPHFGGVIIGENVEIGANTCIDRGTIDNTIIGNNVKIDNLCHIAHNVHIKEKSYVIALSMLGGSCTLEESTYIAPGVLIRNQIIVGANSLVGMGSVVTKNVEPNTTVVGVPAKCLVEKRKMNK